MEGGFPEIIGEERKENYINELVEGILKNDIERRYKISYKAAFEKMANHIMNIAPSKLNYMDLTSLFGFKSSHTAENYVEYLKKAYLLCLIPKFSYKSSIRTIGSKAYTIDIALMNKRKEAFAMNNLGWRLETIVLIELFRRYRAKGFDVAYFDDSSRKCDFLVCKGSSSILAVQVCYDISNKKTLKREIKGLKLVAEKTGCKDLLLISNYEDRAVEENDVIIRIVPAYSWLVDI